MKYIVILLLVILPTIVLWRYINKLDKNKEPGSVLFGLFFGGILSVILALFISFLLSFIFTDFFEYEVTFSLTGFLYSILGIGLVEELSKFLMMFIFGWHTKELDETYDVILYTMIVALGFATAENLVYSISGGISASLFRIFTAVPGHVINGAFMGHFLCLYRLNKKNKGWLILSLLVPAVLHGIYDFIVYICDNNMVTLIFAIYVIIEFVIAKHLVHKMADTSSGLPYDVIYCSNCGMPTNSRFCPNCGKERE